MRMNRLAVPILAALLVAGCVQREPRFTETVDRTWPAAELRNLNLEGMNGSINITASSDSQIHMSANVTSHGEQASDVLRIETDGDTLRISQRHHSNRAFPFFLFSDNGARIDYNIQVPPQTNLDVTTANGRVEITGVRGDHKLRSVNGRIEVTTPDAKVDATTVNGRIIAKFTSEFRGARLRTVNGSVRVMVPPHSAISADVDTVNGSFNSNIPVNVSSDRTASSGADHEYPLDVTTVNGSVTVSEISHDGS